MGSGTNRCHAAHRDCNQRGGSASSNLRISPAVCGEFYCCRICFGSKKFQNWRKNKACGFELTVLRNAAHDCRARNFSVDLCGIPEVMV